MTCPDCGLPEVGFIVACTCPGADEHPDYVKPLISGPPVLKSLRRLRAEEPLEAEERAQTASVLEELFQRSIEQKRYEGLERALAVLVALVRRVENGNATWTDVGVFIDHLLKVMPQETVEAGDMLAGEHVAPEGLLSELDLDAGDIERDHFKTEAWKVGQLLGAAVELEGGSLTLPLERVHGVRGQLQFEVEDDDVIVRLEDVGG